MISKIRQICDGELTRHRLAAVRCACGCAGRKEVRSSNVREILYTVSRARAGEQLPLARSAQPRTVALSAHARGHQAQHPREPPNGAGGASPDVGAPERQIVEFPAQSGRRTGEKPSAPGRACQSRRHPGGCQRAHNKRRRSAGHPSSRRAHRPRRIRRRPG